jgi:hypothetical protein
MAFGAAITTGGPGMLSMAGNAEDAAAQPVVEVAQGRLLGSRIWDLTCRFAFGDDGA